jgi:hypothetical protein
MFVVVGRFRFLPVSPEERQRIVQGWEQEFAPLARESPGFGGVQCVRLQRLAKQGSL